jgi:hypothetical protein
MIRDGEHRPTRTRIAGSRPAPDKPRLFGLLTLSGTGTHPVYGELSGVTDDVTSQCATRVSSYLTASESAAVLLGFVIAAVRIEGQFPAERRCRSVAARMMHEATTRSRGGLSAGTASVPRGRSSGRR